MEELQATQGSRPYAEVFGETSRNKSDYRSISSLSELTYYSSQEDIPSNETLEKVAYTHNGVTVLLYDSIDNYDSVYLYPFVDGLFIGNSVSASNLDKYIDAGGWTRHHSSNGVDWVDEWIPISNFQLY